MTEAGVERTGKRLTPRDHRPPPSPSVPIVLFVIRFGFFLDHRFDDLFHIPDFDQHIFGLQIGVDDATFAVQVIQPEQHLFGDLLHEGHGYPSMFPSLDEAQQVLPQDLKHHADVHAVGTLVLERIEQADHMFLARMIRIRLDDLVQQLDLINGGLGVVSGRPDHLQRDMPARKGVPGKPDGRKMAPPELPHDDVPSVFEEFAHADGMITAFAVILRILLFGGGLGPVIAGGRGR